MPARRILALDLSPSSTGYAIGDGEGPPHTGRVGFQKPERGAMFWAFSQWLSGMLKVDRPDLIAVEAAILKVDKTKGVEAMRQALGMCALAEAISSGFGIDYREVQVSTWRKSFCGSGHAQKPEVVALCKLLGWPIGDSHDRADAAGLWAHAHVFHGNTRAMHRQLSVGSFKRLEGGGAGGRPK